MRSDANFPSLSACGSRLVVRVTLIVPVRRAARALREAFMLVALLGRGPAVLRAERLDPGGTRKRRQHAKDGITRMPSAVYKV